MPYYTTNLCVNPSFQLGTQGYSALANTTISLDSSRFKFGRQSLYVSTAGHVAGEGILTAGGLVTTASLCSLSVYLFGSGTIVVSTVANPGGAILNSNPVLLSSGWQRVVIDQISASPGQTLLLMITTATAQEATFWVSGVQIEPESPAHAYCDGDQIGCFWLGGTPGGISVQPLINPAEATSSNITTSGVVQILSQAKVFGAVPKGSSVKTASNVVAVTGPGPVAAMTDFAIFELADPDPAMTYQGWSNAGTNTGTAGAYNRIWATFLPPLDYVVSGNQLLWPRAAYMAVGFASPASLNNGTVNITDVQAEILPLSTGIGQPAPSAYDYPRALHSIIKPTRLNYCPNPSAEVSLSGWSAISSGALSQDTLTVGKIAVIDEIQYTSGSSSLKVTVNSSGDGAQLSVPDLIAGDTYIASAYIQAGTNLSNITMFIGNSTTSIVQTGGTGYGTGGYGTGYYGGSPPSTTALATGSWFRINTVFTASDATQTLSFTASTVNFLTGQNTNFDGGIGNWIATTNCSVAENLVHFHAGTGSMSLTSTAAGSMTATGFTLATVTTNGLPVTPGQLVSSSAWFLADSLPRQCRVQVDWFDSTGAFLSTSTVSTVTNSTTVWTKSSSSFTAPANAAYARPSVGVLNTGAAGEIHYVDDVYLSIQPVFWIDAILIEAGQVLGTYFDGSFGKNYSWETGGTAGLTRSYYYEQSGVKQKAVANTLTQHTPLGISYVTPLYSTPYTQ